MYEIRKKAFCANCNGMKAILVKMASIKYFYPLQDDSYFITLGDGEVVCSHCQGALKLSREEENDLLEAAYEALT